MGKRVNRFDEEAPLTELATAEATSEERVEIPAIADGTETTLEAEAPATTEGDKPASDEQPKTDSPAADRELARVALFYDGEDEHPNFWVRSGDGWVCVHAHKGQNTELLDQDVADALLKGKKGFSLPVGAQEIGAGFQQPTAPGQK